MQKQLAVFLVLALVVYLLLDLILLLLNLKPVINPNHFLSKDNRCSVHCGSATNMILNSPYLK